MMMMASVKFEIKKINPNHLNSLNISKPGCMDDLDGKLLKTVANCIAGPVCHIFNSSIKKKHFPDFLENC